MEIVRNSRGLTLVEFVASSAIAIVSTLALSYVMREGISLYQSSLDEIQTSESVVMASYLLKKVMSQAVKVSCCEGNGLNCSTPPNPGAIPFPTYNLTVTSGVGNEPQFVGEGKIDCRPGSALWAADTENALGLFVRDVGADDANDRAASRYRGTAVYFIPPVAGSTTRGDGENSARLVFKDSAPGGALTTILSVDRLVNVEVVPGSVELNAASRYLTAISYKITARHFMNSTGGVKHYRTGAPPTAPHKDVESIIKIVFKNNRIGQSAVNGNTSERPLGQIYFFNFITPNMSVL